jgi:hypothetical protein
LSVFVCAIYHPLLVYYLTWPWDRYIIPIHTYSDFTIQSGPRRLHRRRRRRRRRRYRRSSGARPKQPKVSLLTVHYTRIFERNRPRNGLVT